MDTLTDHPDSQTEQSKDCVLENLTESLDIQKAKQTNYPDRHSGRISWQMERLSNETNCRNISADSQDTSKECSNSRQTA